MPQKQSLRCFSKKDEDQWISVCIDLNLAAQADTQEESRRKLESMIRTYVRDAYTCHVKYKDQLLNRPAPLSIFLEYYKIVVLVFLVNSLTNLSKLVNLPMLRHDSINEQVFLKMV